MNNGQVIKEFNGHSGSKVYLMEDDIRLFVRKIGNVDRNFERLHVLEHDGFPVPKTYKYIAGETLDMEYLHGLDMKNYLIHNNINKLVDFIHKMVYNLSLEKHNKDYTEVYESKLNIVDFKHLPFTKEELLNRLPKELPQTIYHGDMTLENIMYTQNGFFLIDAMTTEYDSYIFDIAKMRQDLECKWFLRHSDVRLDTKLQNIQNKLREKHPEAFNDYILILMLLRVLQKCELYDFNYMFLMKEINRLWK